MKTLMSVTAPLPLPRDSYALPLRLIVGYGFLEHGLAKLMRGGDHFVAILAAMGLPFSEWLGWATIALELLCGVLILAGAFLPLVALPAISILLVAIVTVHLPNGFSSIKLLSYDAMGAHFGAPGYETDLLYIGAIVALCIGGTGPWSVDRAMRRAATRRPAPNAGADRPCCARRPDPGQPE